MKPVADVTCCIVDTGIFLPMAFRMAEQCKRVIYCPPAEITPAKVGTGFMGDGFPAIEAKRNFWDDFDEIDLFCFPDCHHGELQIYLESVGKSVWGSRRAERLELNREYFMTVIKSRQLDVPVYEVIRGLPALREHLRDKEDKYLKVSRFRGDMETTHWRNWKEDRGWLDWIAIRLGPIGDRLNFLVFDNIETDLEIGADTYCVDGDWPGTMLNGLEWKDKSYFAAVTRREDMPDSIQHTLEAFSPVLKEFRYRQQWSMEVRVKDDKAYFIDATTRGGLPSSASQQLLWKNFADIVWHGANGHLIEPEPSAQYSIECMVTAKTEPGTWETVELPKELNRNCRFSHCVFVDGAYCFPPDDLHAEDLGWLCATGNTPKETLDEIKRLADLLPDGLNADVENLAGVLKEIETAKKEGIPFTEQPVPDPAEVL